MPALRASWLRRIFSSIVLHGKVQPVGDLLRVGVEIAHLVAQQQRGE